MKQISRLSTSLNNYFGWNKARMSCFTKMLISLFAVKTVNLSEIAVGFIGKAQKESNYRRAQRFFLEHEIDMDKLAIFLFFMFFNKNKQVYLTIDRTNWYWGKSKINILTLGIAYEGVAIPILWELLEKAGNASGDEHKSIVERFVKIFGKDLIAGILADREFANKDFFEWLTKNEVPFFIRVKEGAKVQFFREKKFKLEKIFKSLDLKKQMSCIQPVIIHGQKLFVSAGRSENGELLIVATNQQNANAVSAYLRRWEIESLFQCLKSRGFRFEETHVTDLKKISKIMALLSIGFCWAHKVGEWRDRKRPIRFKKFLKSRRPQYSYFRYGLDWIREIILHIYCRAKQFDQCLQQLIFPDKSMIDSLLEGTI